MGYNVWHFSPITMAEMVCKVAQHRLYILNWPINGIENPKTMSSLISVLYFVCLFVCLILLSVHPSLTHLTMSTFLVWIYGLKGQVMERLSKELVSQGYLGVAEVSDDPYL